MSDPYSSLADLPSFFDNTKKTPGSLSYDELLQRRRLAYALATRQRPFPKTIGEGLTALGEAWGQRGVNQDLEEREAQQRAKDIAARKELLDEGPQAVPPGVLPPPVAAGAQPPLPGAQPAPPGAQPAPIIPQAPSLMPKRPPAPPIQALGAQPEGPIGQPGPIPPGALPVRDQLALGSLANTPSSVVASGEGARPAEATPGQAVPPVPRVQIASAAPPGAPNTIGDIERATGYTTTNEPTPPVGRDQLALSAVTPPPARVAQAQIPPPGTAAPVPAAQPPIPKAPETLPDTLPQPKPAGPAPTFQSVLASPEGQNLQTRMETAKRIALQNVGSPTGEQAMKNYEDLRKQAQDLYKNQWTRWHELDKAAEAARVSYPERATSYATSQQALKDKLHADKLRAELGDVPLEVLTKRIEKSAEDVKAVPQATQALADVRAQLDKGIFTGLLAPAELLWAKGRTVLGADPDPRIAATESFQAMGKPLLAAARQALVGGAQISNADMQLSERAIAGDIKLEGKTMTNVMDALERIQFQTALHHQSVIATVAGSDPARARQLYGAFGLPVNTMAQLVPKDAVNDLVTNISPERIQQFNQAFHTPKLAETIILRERERRTGK